MDNPGNMGVAVMELAQKDPEAAKEWLRMAIKIESGRGEPEADFIAHLEEGISIIDAMVALTQEPGKAPGFSLKKIKELATKNNL